MHLVSSRHLIAVTLAVPAASLGSVFVAASGAAAPVSAAAVTPQPTVTGTVIPRRTGTLAPGTKVKSSALFGSRVFTDGKHGFALAQVSQAQYPVATSDGGKTWKTDGPALHINAAQAPLTVLDIGAASTKTAFAYGGGQVIDATSNGGGKWYGALFNGLVMAVVVGTRNHLVAFIDASASTSNSNGVIWQYVSKDGGHSWHYDTTVGGS